MQLMFEITEVDGLGYVRPLPQGHIMYRLREKIRVGIHEALVWLGLA